MKVYIKAIDDQGDESNEMEIELSQQVLDAIRVSFNPSGDSRVGELKVVSAALLQMIKNVGEYTPRAQAAASVAAVNVETASMWAVKAATA